jgi:hypothetical protein
MEGDILIRVLRLRRIRQVQLLDLSVMEDGFLFQVHHNSLLSNRSHSLQAKIVKGKRVTSFFAIKVPAHIPSSSGR